MIGMPQIMRTSFGLLYLLGFDNNTIGVLDLVNVHHVLRLGVDISQMLDCFLCSDSLKFDCISM